MLADHATQGDAHQVEAIESGGVGHPQHIAGEVSHGEGTRTGVGVADAAMIEGDHSVLAHQGFDLRTPDHPAHSEPHDEEHRRAV